MNRRMPNGMYGGVRGGLNSPYSIDIRVMDTGHVCIRASFKKSARYKQGGGMVSEAETGYMDVFVMKGIWICP